MHSGKLVLPVNTLDNDDYLSTVVCRGGVECGEGKGHAHGEGNGGEAMNPSMTSSCTCPLHALPATANLVEDPEDVDEH